jgi:regulator of sigma E protease
MANDVLQFLMLPFTKVLPFLVVLTVVVFIHELGHFLVARWCGVAVRTFSIGFGKEIWGFNDRQGTRWRLAWIPLGGYVKFMDDENAASVPSREAIEAMTPAERAGSFHAKPVWKRAAVVAAGPIANFILAIAIFALWFGLFGVHSTEARIANVLPDTPAARAGFVADDLILSVGGDPIKSFEDVQRIVSTNVGRPLLFKVQRGSDQVELTATPELREQTVGNQKMSTVVIGIRRSDNAASVKLYQPGPLEALGLGVDQTKFIITSTLGYLGDVIGGRQKADQLGGPARIGDLAAKVADKSVIDLVYLIGFISVSVGLINLFPIPLLDGGHLLFYAIEAIRRKPLSEGAQEVGFRIGFAVVLMLMIFATFNDLPVIRGWFSAG